MSFYFNFTQAPWKMRPKISFLKDTDQARVNIIHLKHDKSLISPAFLKESLFNKAMSMAQETEFSTVKEPNSKIK